MSAAEAGSESTTDAARDLVARLAAAEERARIYEEMAQRTPEPAAPPAATAQPEKLTRQQVLQLVEQGRVDQATADEYIRNLDKEELRVAVTKEVRASLTAEERAREVGKGLAEYRQLIPGLGKKGSEEWNRANEEYGILVNELGMPEGPATELLAARNAFGPRESLRHASQEPRRESHRETGGGGGSGTRGPRIPKVIRDNGYESEFQKGIDRGEYKGWDDPKLKQHADKLEAKLLARAARGR